MVSTVDVTFPPDNEKVSKGDFRAQMQIISDEITALQVSSSVVGASAFGTGISSLDEGRVARLERRTQHLSVSDQTSTFAGNLVVFPDGSELAPSIVFNGATTTGFHRAVTANVGVAASVAGNLVALLSSVNGGAISVGVGSGNEVDASVFARITGTTGNAFIHGLDDQAGRFQNTSTVSQNCVVDILAGGESILAMGDAGTPSNFRLSYDNPTDVFVMRVAGTDRLRVTQPGIIDFTLSTGLLTDAGALPTSDPSNTGQLWNNSGVVTVS